MVAVSPAGILVDPPKPPRCQDPPRGPVRSGGRSLTQRAPVDSRVGHPAAHGCVEATILPTLQALSPVRCRTQRRVGIAVSEISTEQLKFFSISLRVFLIVDYNWYIFRKFCLKKKFGKKIVFQKNFTYTFGPYWHAPLQAVPNQAGPLRCCVAVPRLPRRRPRHRGHPIPSGNESPGRHPVGRTRLLAESRPAVTVAAPGWKMPSL